MLTVNLVVFVVFLFFFNEVRLLRVTPSIIRDVHDPLLPVWPVDQRGEPCSLHAPESLSCCRAWQLYLFSPEGRERRSLGGGARRSGFLSVALCMCRAHAPLLSVRGHTH